MKRRSRRNPINFVHSIHICNFVFAIQWKRHASRNRFPTDSSNRYVYFFPFVSFWFFHCFHLPSLIATPPSSIHTLAFCLSVARQMTANFYSSDCICNSHTKLPFLIALFARLFLNSFKRLSPFLPGIRFGLENLNIGFPALLIALSSFSFFFCPYDCRKCG